MPVVDEQLAKDVFEAEVYRSYNAEDVELFRDFTDVTARAVPGAYVDFLGRITRSRFIYTCGRLTGLVSHDPPIPSDRVYADAIEYTGLLTAIRSVDDGHLVVAELGAGWGPWMAAAGVAARLKKIGKVDLIGIEGSRGKIEHMKDHLADNGLRPRGPDDQTLHGNVGCRCVHGVIWSKTGTAQFPVFDPEKEFGVAATTELAAGRGVDYRGLTFDYETVPAYRVQDILGEYRKVDFIHMDIQGAEVEVCRAAIEFLSDHVRYLFVATHSRKIEGELISLLLPRGFQVLREKPCRFRFDTWPGTLEALTIVDGGQLWRNSRFSRPASDENS
jgi:FkbM family methyltransferase